ncbi:4-hydroxy-tetrahydrodipicolinate synthase [Georgenia soli]|uniref:4-hydroxy-tetrahydrodipicolinate synthase n=1 Tax=Georgenia soli TaxID=638953 RepID=A0A2A9F2R6_9MICO|nr:dihydrodipicolinate synthase family protein [Georgenia soli]PFG45106.1 4-hydroxy-tetrahydrodipicolinate synthase [Georgenia soli]
MSVKVLDPGVWAVSPTPFSGNSLSIDESSLDRISAHYEAIGATGITVLGVLGEAASLDSEEKRVVLETVMDACDLPIVAGMVSRATAPVIEEARLAADVLGDRLAGVMVQVNSANVVAAADHLNMIHDATGLGIVVQDYPLVSGVHISAPALVQVVKAAQGVVAVKAESAPSPGVVGELAANLDVPVFGGLGGVNLIDELAFGAAGAMTGFSFTEGLLECVRGWNEGGFEAARAAYSPYLPLINFEAQRGINVGIRKEAIRRLGHFTDSSVRPPVQGLPDGLSPVLAQHLAALGAR